MNGEHTSKAAHVSEDQRITFRCKYPDNCSCCSPNREAFVAVRADAERLQREQTEDLKRMERATETIERLTRKITQLERTIERYAEAAEEDGNV